MSSKELLAAHKASSNESGKAHYTDIVKTLASTKNTPKKSTNRVSLGLGLGNLDPLAAMTEAVTTGDNLQSNPMPVNRSVSNDSYDDWESFQKEYHDKSKNMLMLVNVSPATRRKLSEGQISVETFLGFQFHTPDAALKFIIVFVSDGKESLMARNNQKRYHPEQTVFALDIEKAPIRNSLNALRKEIVRTGTFENMRQSISLSSPDKAISINQEGTTL